MDSSTDSGSKKDPTKDTITRSTSESKSMATTSEFEKGSVVSLDSTLVDGIRSDVSKTMDEIHQTFKAVVDEFSGDKAADKLMAEYDKLYDHVKNTHRELHNWKLRCAGLAEDMKHNTDKLNLAIHLSQEDKALIVSLNKQSADAWGLVDDLHEREKKAKDSVSRMEDEIHVLTSMVENGMGLDELLKLSNKAGEEIKSLDDANKYLKDELAAYEVRYLEVIERNSFKVQQLDDTINKLNQKNEDLLEKAEEDKVLREDFQQKIYRLERVKLRMVGDRQRLDTEMAAQAMMIKKQQDTLTDVSKDRDNFKELYSKEKANLHQAHKNYDELKKKFERQAWKLGDTEDKNLQERNKVNLLNNQLQIKGKDLKQREEELEACKKQLMNQGKALIKTKENLTSCGETLKVEKTEVQFLETSLSNAMKELEESSRSLNKALSNLDQSEGALKKMQKQKKTVDEELKSTAENNVRLYSELSSAHRNIRAVLDKLHGCINEKERLIISLNVQATHIAKLESDIATRDLLNQMLEKNNTQMTKDLTEAIRSKTHAINERDSIQGELNTAEMENTDLRSANANVLKQAKSLQCEILNKEHMVEQMTDKLKALRAQYDHVCNDLIHADMEKDRLKTLLFQTEAQLKVANNMIESQLNIISDKNIKIKQITSHRNILGATCVKNNAKIDMLLTRHDLQMAILNNGNRLYDERLKEIKLLHLQNTQVWRQKDNIMKQLQSIDNLKSKLSLANTEMVNCKARLRALEDQPQNHIHAWMTIKAKDYSKYELIMKSNHLVKKLIIKTDEVAHLETALTEKAHILDSMKKLLSKGPGPDMMFNAALDRKKKEATERKLKVALAEINMAEWKAEEKTEENNKIKKELVEEKKKRMQVIRGCQKSVKKCEKRLESERRLFLPPIVNKGF